MEERSLEFNRLSSIKQQILFAFIAFFGMGCSAAAKDSEAESLCLLQGVWQSKKGSLFGEGRDYCVFLGSGKVSCISYPEDGDLVLEFLGWWEATEDELKLVEDRGATATYDLTVCRYDEVELDSGAVVMVRVP